MSVGVVRFVSVAAVASLLTIGQVPAPSAHSTTTPTPVVFDDFEQCKPPSSDPRFVTYQWIQDGDPSKVMRVNLYEKAPADCLATSWTTSGQAWLAKRNGGTVAFPSGEKAIWLNEIGGKMSRSVSELEPGYLYEVSVQAWTDRNVSLDTFLDIRLNWTVDEVTYSKDIIKLIPAGSGIRPYSRQFCAYDTSVGVELFQPRRILASPMIDDFSIVKTGERCIDYDGDNDPDTAPVFVEGLVFPDFIARVSFLPNGGSGDAYAQESNRPATLEPLRFTRDGHTFAGWTTLIDGDESTYSDQAEYSFERDLVLFALWTPNPAPPPDKKSSVPEPEAPVTVDRPILAATGVPRNMWPLGVSAVLIALGVLVATRRHSTHGVE